MAADCLRLAIQAKNARGVDAGLAELIAQLALHAEDAVEQERAEMHRQDESRGVGA